MYEQTTIAWCCIQGSCAALVWPQICAISCDMEALFVCVWRCSYCLPHPHPFSRLILYASDMRDEATRSQHLICWILWIDSEAPRPHINVMVKDDHVQYRVMRKVTQDVFIFRIRTAYEYITSAADDAAERLYQMRLTWEIRWSLEYESEFNMICLCLLFSHTSEARGVNLRCYCFYLSIEVIRYTWQVACSRHDVS